MLHFVVGAMNVSRMLIFYEKLSVVEHLRTENSRKSKNYQPKLRKLTLALFCNGLIFHAK